MPTKTRHSPRRRMLVRTLGILTVAMLGLLLFVSMNRRAVAAVDRNSQTIANLFAHYPDARVYRIDLATGERWECVLTRPAVIGASGPPAFTYDVSGRRIAWTFDDGDEPSYTSRVRAGVRTPIPPSEALAEVGRR